MHASAIPFVENGLYRSCHRGDADACSEQPGTASRAQPRLSPPPGHIQKRHAPSRMIFPISPGTLLALSLAQLQTRGLAELFIQLICTEQETWGWCCAARGAPLMPSSAGLQRWRHHAGQHHAVHLPARRAQKGDLEAAEETESRRKAVLHCRLQRCFPTASH